jgi:hypothetical protein
MLDVSNGVYSAAFGCCETTRILSPAFSHVRTTGGGYFGGRRRRKSGCYETTRVNTGKALQGIADVHLQLAYASHFIHFRERGILDCVLVTRKATLFDCFVTDPTTPLNLGKPGYIWIRAVSNVRHGTTKNKFRTYCHVVERPRPFPLVASSRVAVHPTAAVSQSFNIAMFSVTTRTQPWV